MKKLLYVYCLLNICLIQSYLYGWATPGQNIDHVARPKVNFSGSIRTHQGNEWKNVENITIDGRYSQISMFIVPEKLPSKVINEQTGKDEIILQEDPHGRPGYTTVKIDLADIKSIRSVPHFTYVYKQATGNSVHVTSYFEIIITPKDSAIEPYHCLVPETVQVKYDHAGSMNMETSIGAISLLEITHMKPQEVHEASNVQLK